MELFRGLLQDVARYMYGILHEARAEHTRVRFPSGASITFFSRQSEIMIKELGFTTRTGLFNIIVSKISLVLPSFYNFSGENIIEYLSFINVICAGTFDSFLYF